MTDRIHYLPEGFHPLTPYLAVRGGLSAIQFYRAAFGAEVVARILDNGGTSLVHATLRIHGATVMLADESPQRDAHAPRDNDTSPVALYLYVPDVEGAFERAVHAGAHGLLPPTVTFWGDQICRLRDPHGHLWILARQLEHLTPEQIEHRAAQATDPRLTRD